MPDPTLTELIARWQDQQQQGRRLSLDELCADCPERLDELKQHLQAVLAMEDFLGLKGRQAGGQNLSAEYLSDRAHIAPSDPRGEGRGDGPLPQIPGYEVVEQLARGGMGVVYKARQIALKRLVAVKMILASEYAVVEDRKRFRTEAEAIARLQHPNIVQIFEVGEYQGHPFFSLEFCPEGSLDRKLAGTPIEAKEAARLVEALAHAMHVAHQANVVHRDLKPGNVLLVGLVPKVTDFGLAKKLDQSGQTQTGAVMGTPSYMAPEQAEGSKAVGPLADVYALGAILYECLTGRPPFRAATVMDTLIQVVSQDPVSPRELNAQVPPDLETITLKCLRKEPGKRYGSAAELAEDLHRWQAGEPIRARKTGLTERAARWCRRNPILALWAGLAVVLFLSSTILTIMVTRNARADRQRLLQSLIEQARAERQAGNRQRSLARIADVASIRVDDELRQEAIETICAPGVRLMKEVSARAPVDSNGKSETGDLHKILRDRLSAFGFSDPPYEVHGRSSHLTGEITDSRDGSRVSRAEFGDPWVPFRVPIVVFIFRRAGKVPEPVLVERTPGQDYKVLAALPADDTPGGFRMSQDGAWLAFRDRIEPDLIRLWDCRRMRLHGRLDGRAEAAIISSRNLPGAEFSPDSTFLASTHWRAGKPILQLDEVSSCRVLKAIAGIRPVQWTANGRYLLTCGESMTGEVDKKEGGC